MKRIFEELAIANVFAPQSVDASTDKTTSFVDASGAEEVTFLISTAALGAGKALTVTLMGSENSEGSGAVAVGDATVFTDSVGTDPQIAVVSYKVSPEHGRYVGVKFQHNGDAAVICGVTAAAKSMYLPAVNGWTLAM
jgi:hypothetical protein